MRMKTIILFFALLISVQIAIAVTQNLVYDANGNLITGDGKYRTYDSFNHLVQVRSGSDSSGLILENYTWHPAEERLFAKAVYEANGSWKETIYYPFKNLVRVKNATGKFDYKYIYLNGQLIAQEDYAGRKLFFHNDHLGSVSLITDEAGNKVEGTFYSPFGEIISGGAVSRYDYTGKEYDSAVGDYDFNARKMKPEWGVFTTADPTISEFEPQTLNRYSYVKNNPYKYVDPDGKFGVIFPQVGGGQAALIEGGAVSGGPAFSWTKEGGFQKDFVTSDSYVNDLETGKRGYGVAELSANIGLSFFKGNVADLKGKSSGPKGFGLSVGPYGGQIEWTPSIFSISYSPGLGIDIHNYAVSYTNLYSIKGKQQEQKTCQNCQENQKSGGSSISYSTVTLKGGATISASPGMQAKLKKQGMT